MAERQDTGSASASAGEGSSEIDKARRVLSGVPSTSKHGIVAGALAFELQPAAQHPHERIEPACGAQDLCGDLGAPVSAPHMRQFVTEHQSGAVVGPMSCPSGNHHGWRAPSPRGKKRRMVDLQQPHGTAKAKAIRRFCQRPDPCRLDHRRGAPRARSAGRGR